MPITTIKKAITKGEELVIMPRREYERLVFFKKEKDDLDTELLEAIQEIKQGKLLGPFNSVRELKKSLEK